MNDKMERSEKLKENHAKYPGSTTDDSKTGTSEDVDGAGGMHSQEGINMSQNTPSQNNTCHDKNGATETGTLLNFTEPEESRDQAGETTSPIDKSGGARDNFADTGRSKCVCSKNGTYFDGTHDDVVSDNVSSGDQKCDGAESSDVMPDDVMSPGPDYENEKSGEVKSGGTESTAMVSGDAMSDNAEHNGGKTSSNETDGVSMGHVKTCDDTGDSAVPSSNIITGNDDNRQNEISTDTESGEQTPSDRKEEGQRDENSEKEFDASNATVIEEDSLNLRFYRNEINSKPFPGEKIDNMLQWKGDYVLLERSHSYIQWLFPIPEGRGMNYSAQELQEHEAKTIREDETLRARVLEAFKMMLDFYGMQLVDDKTGEVRRADNWQERYEHLDRSVHNRFRITRILKALGELGFEHLQEPWLEFIMHEATVNHALPSLNGNCMVHWIEAIKDYNKHDKLFFLLIELKEQLQKQYQGSEEAESSGEMQDNVKEKDEDKNVSDDDRHTKEETTPEKGSKDHETKNEHVNAKKDKKESMKPSEAVLEISGEQANLSPLNNPSEKDNVKIDTSHQSNGTTGCKSTEGVSENGQYGDDDLNRKADKEIKNESDSDENVNRNIHNPAEFKNEQSSEVCNSAIDNNAENEDNLEENGEHKMLETTV